MTLATALIALLPATGSAQAHRLTPDQILAMSHRAYDSVQSLEMDTAAKSGIVTANAHILWSKPRFFRATGTAHFGSAKYASKYEVLVANSSVSVFNANSWQSVPDANQGLATVTGLAATAPTYVGSMLLHTSWGNFSSASTAHYRVSEQPVDGHACYCLSGTKPWPIKLWFDKHTMFLVKSSVSVMGNPIEVHYSTPQLNARIPASRFRK